MKKVIQIALAAMVSLALVGVTQAAPKGKDHRIGKPGTVSEVEALKPGDQYAVVCTMCQTVEVKQVAKGESGASLAKEGGTMTCAGCKNEATIKRVGPTGKQRLSYVNKKGKECMFLAPLSKKS